MAGGRGAGQGRPRHPGTATTRHRGTTSATLIKWSGQRAGAAASLLSDDEYTIFGEGAYYLLLLVKRSYLFRAKFGCRMKLVAPSIKTSLSMPAPTSALCLAAAAVLHGESDSFTGVVIVSQNISQSSTVSGWQCLGEMKEPSPQIVFQLLLHSTPPWVHCQWWPRY